MIIGGNMNKVGDSIHNILRGGKIMKRNYTVVIHKCEEDEGGYWAECLEIKGVFAQGNDIEKIKKDMEKGILLMLEELEEQARANDINAQLVTLEVQHA